MLTLLKHKIAQFFYPNPSVDPANTYDDPNDSSTYYDPLEHQEKPIPTGCNLINGIHMQQHVLTRIHYEPMGKILCRVKHCQPFVIRWQNVSDDVDLCIDVDRGVACTDRKADVNLVVEVDKCAICMDKDADVLLFPCAHRHCCLQCLVSMLCRWKGSGPPTCPMCRCVFYVLFVCRKEERVAVVDPQRKRC